jgi:hypothetical protein
VRGPKWVTTVSMQATWFGAMGGDLIDRWHWIPRVPTISTLKDLFQRSSTECDLDFHHLRAMVGFQGIISNLGVSPPPSNFNVP